MTIERPVAVAAVQRHCAEKPKAALYAQGNSMSGKFERGRELSAALDTNWSGTISTGLFISRLMHYSLLVRTDTYDNAMYVITSDNAIRRTYVAPR